MRWLFAYEHVEDAWISALEPWCLRAAAHALETGGMSWLVCASRGQADWARDRLHAAGHSTLGLAFLDPFALRRRLAILRDVPLATAGREVLALRVRLAAAGNAAAIARDPTGWLEALEELDALGWLNNPTVRSHFVPPALRDFVSSLSQAPDWLPAVDWRLAEFASPLTPPLRLAVLGWDASHAHRELLLRAALFAAEEVTLCVPSPREADDAPSLAWSARLETLCGEEIIPLPETAEGLNSALVSTLSGFARPIASEAQVALLTGETWQDEVERIVGFVVRWLASAPESFAQRCAVVFPGRGPAPILLAHRLRQLGVVLEDRLGERPEPDRPIRLQRALLAYHREERTAPALLRLLTEWKAEATDSPILETEQALARRFRQGLHAGAARVSRETWLAEVVSQLGEWDGEISAGEIRARWAKALHALASGPDDALLKLLDPLWERLQAAVPPAQLVPAKFALDLIDQALSAVPSARASAGTSVPHARVVLVSLAEGCGQTWDAVVVASCIERVWPTAPTEPTSLPDRLRRDWRALAPALPPLPTLGERMAREEARFLDLLAHTSGALAFSSSRHGAEAPDEPAQPNSWTIRALHASGSTDPLRAWRDASRRAPEQSAADALPDGPHLASVRDRRADPKLPFDAYFLDFSTLPRPEGAEVKWSPSSLESIWNTPATHALLEVFGAASRRDLASLFQRNAASEVGSLVHRWLSWLLPKSGKLDADLVQNAIRRIPALREKQEARCRELAGQEADAPMPPWWRSVIAQAQAYTRALLECLEAWAPLDRSWHCETERTLTGQLAGRDGNILRLEGRADAWLWHKRDFVIFDFKTGAFSKSLTGPKPELIRDGLSFVGYAWLLGAIEPDANWRVEVLYRDAPSPVLLIDRARSRELEGALRVFAEIQTKRRYGQRGMLAGDDRSGVETLPMTTVPISWRILKDKLAVSRLSR